MSIKVMSLVWDNFKRGGSEKLAMLALADRSDDEGGSLHPSIAYIAKKINTSESQARRIIHRFIDEGYLSVIANHQGGNPHQTRHYKLNLAMFTPSMDATPSMGARYPLHGCALPLAPMTPDTSLSIIDSSLINTQSTQEWDGEEDRRESKVIPRKRKTDWRPELVKEKTSFAAKSITKPDDVSDQVWGDFLTLRKQHRAPVTETALQGIRREAGKAGLSLSDALEMCCQRGWRGFEAKWLTDNRVDKKGKEKFHPMEHIYESYGFRNGGQNESENIIDIGGGVAESI